MIKNLLQLSLLAVALLFFSFANPAVESSGSEGLSIGDVAPDFSLKNVDGNYVSMSDYEDANGFIIIFSCNHCPFVVAYEDRYNELHEKYAPRGWHLIAINPNDPVVVPEDSFENMQKRAREKEFEFPYVFDDGQRIFPKYGATRTPHVFLLDSDRVVHYIGAIDDNHRDANQVEEKYLENAITAVERGERPNPAETRAIGCTIKVQE